MKEKVANASSQGEKKTKKLQDMSVDDFMNSFGDSGSEDYQDSLSDENIVNGHANGYSSGNSNDDSNESDEGEEEEFEDVEGSSEEEEEEELDEEFESGEEDSGDDDDDVVDREVDEDDETSDVEEGTDDLDLKHKKDLSKLKELDPEFYKYLEDNDKKLLQFNVSDSEDSDNDEDKNVHRLPDKLEVNSDESDFEADDEDTGLKKSGVVTLKLVEKWRTSLQTDRSVQTISEVIQAFHAALLRVAPEEEQSACLFKVDGSAVFNAVVQMCVLDLPTALRKFLGLSSGSLAHANPVKCKRWVKVKTLIRSYAADLLQLLDGIASINIVTILLKHTHQMTPFIVCFPNVTKHFLKKMIALWSSGEETVRVVAFMCILRATSLQQRSLLDSVLRHMYLDYVKNTKFVSPTTLPGINFMRRSLAEIFLLDETVSYHHAFLYIRQLAIHLRNAITLQKAEATQAVCNWQFMSSLALWVEVLGSSSKQALQPLLYPVVQVTTGAIKLVPTAQYYPLRFYCVRLLINLSKNTGTFIPVLPFLLEILNLHDFNKKHTKVTMKPLDLSCILRLSKAQMQENGFKDAAIENVYSLSMEYLANESHSVAFPDLALPLLIQLKDFLKKCKVANYTRKLKQVLDKVEENIKFIENERKTAAFKFSDTKAIEDWETSVKVKGTPLGTFFSSWQKMNQVKQTKMKREEIDIHENLPKIIRPTKKKTKAEGPVELLPSDDSDSDGIGFKDEEEEELPKKTKKRVKKTKVQSKSKKVRVLEDINDVGVDDVVEDMDPTEW